MFLLRSLVMIQYIVGSLRDREVACSASDRQGSSFESCVWRAVSSHSFHHLQDVLLAQFSLHVHKGGLKPYSFHFLPVFLLSHKHPFTQTQCLPPLFLALRRRICVRLPLFIYTDVESVLKDPICHSDECQIGSFSSEATRC